MAEPPFSSTTSPRHLLPLPRYILHPHHLSASPCYPQIYPKTAPLFPLPLLPPATPSPANPRPPLGYTVPGDEHDVEVIEEYKEGPLHRPVHAVAKEKRQSHQIDAKAEPKP